MKRKDIIAQLPKSYQKMEPDALMKIIKQVEAQIRWQREKRSFFVVCIKKAEEDISETILKENHDLVIYKYLARLYAEKTSTQIQK